MPVRAGVVGAGERPTRRDPAETFTGVVLQELLIAANAPSRLAGLVDTFAPGARTAWHLHPETRSGHGLELFRGLTICGD